MKKIVFVIPRGKLDGSAIKRVYDLQDPFRSRGVQCRIISLDWEWLWRLRAHSDRGSSRARWLIRLGNGTRLLTQAQRLREARTQRLFRKAVRWCHAVVFHRVLIPDKGPWRELMLEAADLRPTVFDFDDALWLQDPTGFSEQMKVSQRVVAGNAYLANYAKGFHDRVDVIPTGIRLDRYDAQMTLRRQRTLRDAPKSLPTVIGWVGSLSTTPYLHLVAEPLARLARTHPLVLSLVGADPRPQVMPDWDALGVPTRQWTTIPYEAAAHVPGFDMGIMPMSAGPFEEGKCGAKLLEYMAAGIPGVGSPIGFNRELVTPGVTGFLPESPDEWFRVLDDLIRNPSLRNRIGAAGKELVRTRYDSPILVDQWCGVFRELAATDNRPLLENRVGSVNRPIGPMSSL